MLNAALLIAQDESAWLAALDYADVWSLDTVATPNRIDEATTALDSGAVDHAKVYEAVGAVYFEEDGRPVTIEPVAGSYTIYADQSGSFSYRVEDDIITVKTIPTAWSMEGEIVYQLSSKKEDKAWEVVVSSVYSPSIQASKVDLSSIATGYVESRSGELNTLRVHRLKDSKTRDCISLTSRDAAVMFCYYKAAEQMIPEMEIIPPSNDVRIIVHPANIARAKDANAPRFN
jgi:hypothetical protein